MTHDLRMAAPALVCWGAAAALVACDGVIALTVAVASAVVGGVAVGLRHPGIAVAAVVLGAVAASCAWRLAVVEHSPVTQLAGAHRIATLELEVRRDAASFVHHGSESVVVEVLVRRVVSRGLDLRTHDRATAFVDGGADDLVVGRRLTVLGRLMPSEESDEAAQIDVIRRGATAQAAWWWEMSERVRAGVRTSVEHTGSEPSALIPALVDGDVTRVSDKVKEDFRRSGLTHLMAVSGTNLTIVLAVMLLVGRAAGVRRRGLWVLGAMSIIGFVILARPDPSVVRAAAMGAVGVAALGYGQRGGIRALAWAIIALLFVDPWLSRSAGFVLSVCATGGILLFAPILVRPLLRWMPRWCALAIAVPLAAQLACTPAIVAISGQISLVAVLANLLAGPAVAPATVAGLLGGFVALLAPPVAQMIGHVAGACARWILAVGHSAASLDAASLAWSAPWQLLIVVTPLVAWAIVRLAARPVMFTGLALGLLIGTWRPPHPGWPPPGWLMVACDVGQLRDAQPLRKCKKRSQLRTMYMTTTDKRLRAAIYVRVSHNPDDDRAKPERQISKCVLTAEARDYELVMTTDADGQPCHFVDDDVSAFNGKDRPRYLEVMKMVKAGKVDVVLALHMDRVLRSTKDMLQFIELADETGAILATVQSGDLDLSTSAGRLVATILAAVAQSESERKAERHRLRNEQAAASGLPVGMAGFGFGEDLPMTDHDNKPLLNEDGSPRMVRKETGALHVTEGPLLRDAIERVIAGASVHSICAEWNKQGVLTRQGKQWAHTQLRRVLLRPRNAGLVERKGRILDGVAGQWTPICSVEEFEQIKSRLRSNTRKREPRKHVLTGLLTCQRCSNPMEAAVSSRVHKGKRYSYSIYRCKAANGVKGTFCGISVRSEKAEFIVKNAVRIRIEQEGPGGLVVGPKDIKEAMALRDSRDALYGRLDDLEGLMADGYFSVPKFRKARAEIQAEIVDIEERVAEIEQENAFAKMLTERMSDAAVRHKASFDDAIAVNARFDALALDEKRQVIRQLFKSIEISPALTSRDDPYTRVHFTRPDGQPFRIGQNDEFEGVG